MKRDGEKDSFVFFQGKSYIGWKDLFIDSQSDFPISSLMYELMKVLITVLMMIYVYRIPNESIHCKTLNPERLYYMMVNPGWLHSFQKPFLYKKKTTLVLSLETHLTDMDLRKEAHVIGLESKSWPNSNPFQF